MTNKEAAPAVFKEGLEDIVVATSEICFIDGHEGRLIYRGLNIPDLAEYSIFEETVYLLWYGSLPTRAQLNELKEKLKANRGLPDHVMAAMRNCPKTAHPMAVLRTAVSLLALSDPDADDNSREANIRKSIRMVAQFPTIVTSYHRLRTGKEPVAPNPKLNHAGNFLYMLTGETPEEHIERIFDICLILHADHEFNASTFTARVTAATLSDLHSAITSAIGALKGPLHGGANEQVMKMLLEIGDISKVDSYIKNALAAKKKIMGFGHRVYKTEDPRATVLRKISKELGEKTGNTKWYEMSRRIEELMKQEKHLYANVDFYSASVYYDIGIPIDLYTPIFAVSRISGWTAHVLEQYGHNRLIRPIAEYTGPKDVPYVPIDQR